MFLTVPPTIRTLPNIGDGGQDDAGRSLDAEEISLPSSAMLVLNLHEPSRSSFRIALCRDSRI